MRQVIVIDPSRIDGKLYGLCAQRKPEPNEFVELVTEPRRVCFAVGNAVNVRPDKNWPERWLYDVNVAPGVG